MDFETFKFFEKASRFEDAAEKINKWIEDLADDWKRDVIKKKFARRALQQIIAETDIALKNFQQLKKEALPGHENLMLGMTNQRDNLRENARWLTEMIKG